MNHSHPEKASKKLSASLILFSQFPEFPVHSEYVQPSRRQLMKRRRLDPNLNVPFVFILMLRRSESAVSQDEQTSLEIYT
jgi:hypothetical protein